MAAAGVVVGASGCDDKKRTPRDVAPSAPSAIVDRLGLDAAAIGADPSDPPPPAGDLRAELDRFPGVDACVKERSAIDPLLGDALGAIGYETFVRDACRLLEAAHDKNADRCERIDSGALRSRCKSWVAMVSEAPDMCPLRVPGLPARGREAVCLAVAGRDARMCEGEIRRADRATCAALVARDPAKCIDKSASCAREVERWKRVLREPLGGLPKLPEIKGKLVVRGHGGAPDPAKPEVDVSRDLDHGVVVVTAGERARVEVGVVDLSERTRFGASPNRSVRFGVVLVLVPEIDPKKRKVTLDRVELDVPGVVTLTTPEARCDCRVVSSHLDATRGGAMRLTLEGTISAGPKSYDVRFEASTFVRDVLPDTAGGRRIVPPPGLPAPKASAGLTTGATDAGSR